MPYRNLGLTYRSEVLGHSRYGLVLQADYSSMSTAVKLLLPSQKAKAPTPFSPRHTALPGFSGSSEAEEVAEPPHATQGLRGSPVISRRMLLGEESETDYHSEDDQQLSMWRSLLRRPTSIWLLVIALLRRIAATPGYIISVLNGSRWKQLRARQKVSI